MNFKGKNIEPQYPRPELNNLCSNRSDSFKYFVMRFDVCCEKVVQIPIARQCRDQDFIGLNKFECVKTLPFYVCPECKL